MKWNNFTDCIIESISKNKQNVVFILWGLDAQNKNKIIGNKHYVINSVHPSPLSN